MANYVPCLDILEANPAMNILSLDRLFNLGHDVLDVTSLKTFPALWDMTMIDEYQIESEKMCSRCPVWENKSNQWGDNEHVPQVYKDFIKEVFDCGMLDPYFRFFGRFNHQIYMSHHTAKGYVNPWHGHFLDGMHMHLLVHMGIDKRDPEVDGGAVQVGRIKKWIEFNDYTNIGDSGEVTLLGSVPCHHGQMTVLLNSDPFVVHQVTKVLNDKLRYTFMVACGYRDNADPNKAKIDHL